MNKEFTVAVRVIERYAQTYETYETVVLVSALDMEEAETKVEDWFEKSDIEGHVKHEVEIIKTLPKIH